MPFLKNLVREAVRKAAQDPRVRETASRVFEKEIKPRAKTAWEKAKPEVEKAWNKAKPEVEAAKQRALSRAADLADRVKRGIEESAAAKPDAPEADKESK